LNYLITIIGPTAIGKTSLSIALAQHFKCEIISSDSRQFFKEMTIGTAVPKPEELESARHHFIQNKSIFEEYTVGDFERDALKKLDKLFLKNKVQIMVGGSGLYVDSILKGLDTFPTIDTNIRDEVRKYCSEKGIAFLNQKLQELDPDYFEEITKTNPQTLQNPHRIMRFLEVCIGTGKPYSSFINQEKINRNFTSIIIGLEAERAIMYERINQRVDIMRHEGLLDEAKNVFPNKELNALQTVGYRELFDFFEGKITLDFAIEEIKKNTRRFAKRQMTWFKRTENVNWFDYSIATSEIIKIITAKIENK
jgi:tRNA dimethylallyltransferase